MRYKTKNQIIFFSILLFIIGWSIMLYFISPQKIVSVIGVKNGYILSFLFGVFGVATFTSVSYYPAIITLAAGGLSPILLGLIGGAGMTIGNSLYFYFGLKGRHLLSRRTEEKAEKMLHWITRKPRWLLGVLIFLYVGFTPFPNNLLTASGGVMRCPFKRIIWPLILGNMWLTASIAYLTVIGVQMK